MMGSGKQQLEVISSEVAEHAAVFEKDRVGEFPFLLLEFGDLFLDGPFTDQAVGKHWPCLADAVSPGDRLHLLVMREIEDDLGDAVAITEINENQSPVVPIILDPSAECYGLADVVGPKFATCVGTQHGDVLWFVE